MFHSLFQDRHWSGREERLIRRTTGDGRSWFRRKADDAESRIRDVSENITSPGTARERALISDRETLDAFSRPRLFVRTDRVSAGGNLQLERLLSLTPERRLQEFQRYIERNIPPDIRNRAEHAPLFNPPLNEQDLREYEVDEQNNRIATLLRALKTLSGETVPQEEDEAAFLLARDTLQLKNNTAERPGRLYDLYKQWLDQHPELGKTDSTTPETLLRPDSGIPDELRGALESLVDPMRQAEWLREMFVYSTGRSMDTGLQRLEQRNQYLSLTRSAEEEKLRRETSDVLTNFSNADGRLKILTVAVGLYLGYRAFKAENPLGRFALYGMFGWFAYDRFVNGNENAFNDMANGMKKFVQFSGEKVGDALRAMGLPLHRRNVDRINAMGDFLELHRLPVGPAMTGMACLSSVKLKTIAKAFVPFTEGGRLGGILTIDGGDRTGMEQETDTGYLLGKELKGAMRKMGLRTEERENTFQYLSDNNLEVGKGIAHVFFLLAANRPRNVADADEIGKQMSSVGSYDNLEEDLKIRYQEMVVEGRQIAIDEYPNRSLVEIVESLNARRKTGKEKIADTAAVIEDPRRVPARKNEFALLEETQNLPLDDQAKKKILDDKDDDPRILDGGLLVKDVEEFIRNCENSNLLTPDGGEELKRKFDLLRRSSSPVTEILQAIEKLKYAVMVSASKDRNPLTREQIITMTGPDDLTARSLLGRVENYISRYVISLPRGFHTVGSLSDVRSMLSEPWLGEGPLSSLGVGFKDLEQRIDAYQKQLTDLRNADALSERAAGALPSTVVTAFGGREKLLAALKPIVAASSFQKRIDRAEAHLSQRMALALARSTVLTATPDGYGRREERLAITPKEQANLVREFDAFFLDVIGRTDVWGNGMWRTAEDVEVLERHTLRDLESFDFASEDKRIESIAFARDIAILFVLRVLSGDVTEALRISLAQRVRKIYDQIFKQRDDDIEKATEEVDESLPVEQKNALRQKNLDAAQLIKNKPSYQSLPELKDILKILGITVPDQKDYEELHKDRFGPIVDIVTTTTTTTTAPASGPTESTAGSARPGTVPGGAGPGTAPSAGPGTIPGRAGPGSATSAGPGTVPEGAGPGSAPSAGPGTVAGGAGPGSVDVPGPGTVPGGAGPGRAPSGDRPGPGTVPSGDRAGPGGGGRVDVPGPGTVPSGDRPGPGAPSGDRPGPGEVPRPLPPPIEIDR